MKKILTTIAFVLTLFTAGLAQDLKAGDYIPCPENQKFEGKWEFKNGQYSVTVTLANKKKVQFAGVEFLTDIVQGSVVLLKNGKTVLNKGSAIAGGISSAKTPYVLHASFSDGEGGAGATVLFTFPDKGNLNRLHVSVAPRNHPGMKFKKAPLRMPTTFTLERIAN